ncbi:MAG TPA: ABC transporter substrate-binding protein [Syntrophomonadaceae bacterium]|nr:ABC transporter substrate-binding protein [Syntrophomonadaceae bacterium]
MKKYVVIGLVFTLIFGLVGCATNDKVSDLQEVTIVLDWFPNTNHTGFYVADEKGYYADEGLKVDIVQPSEGGTPQLIAAGKGDFGVSYQEEVTVARSQDIPLVAIATIIQHNTSGYASKAENNITSPRDFVGKTYGGAGTPSETALLKALLEKYDEDLDTVNQLNIGSSDFFTSLENDIDFSLIYYGWTGVEAELKNMPLNYIPLKDEDEKLDFYTPVIIANENKIQNETELVKKFLRATSKGYEFAISNPEEAADILSIIVPELNSDLVKASQKYLAKEYKSDANRWGEMKLETWENFTKFMYDNNLIDTKIDSSQAFTNNYLP